MRYLHFLKFEGGWYYFFDDVKLTKAHRPWLREDFVKFADGCSKTEALHMLEKMFPRKEITYTVLFHEGPRKPGCKDGSRPKKK